MYATVLLAPVALIARLIALPDVVILALSVPSLVPMAGLAFYVLPPRPR